MAGRVNTRFVIILAVSMLVLVGGIVALKWYTSRRDPSRYLAQAEELLNNNDYEKASVAMGRAYTYEKDTTKRVKILMKMADVLQKVPATSTTQARDLLGRVEACWAKVVELEPSNIQAAQNKLNLSYRRAEMAPQYIQLWNALYADAQELLKYSPDNLVARRYRGLAQVVRINNLNLDEQATMDAEADLNAVLAANPDDARAAVALATLDMDASEEAARVNNPAKAEKLQKAAIAQIDAFLTRHPDNAQALMGRFQVLIRVGMRNKSEDTINQAMAVLDQVEKQLLNSDYPDQTRDLANHLALLDTKTIKLDDGTEVRSGLYRAEQLLRHVVKLHKNDVESMVLLGTMLQRQQRWDEALAFFKLARADRAMPVSVEALQANEFRGQAAKDVVDVWLYKQQVAQDRAEKDNCVKLAEQELGELKAIVGEDSPILTLMQGKIALAKGNDREAISKLEKVNTQSEGRNSEVLTWLAQAYMSAQETGAAANTLEKLMQTPQGSMQLKPVLDLARLRLMSGDVNEANKLLDRVMKFQPENVDVLLLKSQATLQAAADKTPDEQKAAVTDALAVLKPLAGSGDRRVVLQLASLNQRAGRTDQALALLNDYMANHKDDMAVLQQLVRFEMQTGHKDDAQKRVETALAADPKNKVLALMLSGIKGDKDIGDQIEKVIQEQSDPLSKQLALWQYYQSNGKDQEADEALAEAAKIAPHDPRVLNIQFTKALTEKDWSAASKIVDRVKKMNNGQGISYSGGAFWEARLLLAQDHAQQAVTTLDRGLKMMPTDSQGWLLMGTAQLATGDNTGAERSLNKSIELKPENPIAWRQLFRLHDQQGDYDQALDDLKRAMSYSPNDNELIMQYISYVGLHGDVRQAINMRLQLAKARPDDADNQRALAELYLNAKQQDKCKAILDELMAKAPDDLANISAMAVYDASTDNFEKGLELIRDYVHKQGDKATANDWVVFARYLRGGNQVEPAMSAYKQAIEKETEPAMPVRREYADWLFAGQRYDDAAEQYAQVLSATDADAPNRKLLVWRRYIETLMNADKLNEADAELAKLIKANPNDPQAQLLKGLLCQRRVADPKITDARKQELSDAADLAYDRAVALAPNSAMAYVQRARFRFDRPDDLVQTQVRDDLNKAIQLDNNNIPARQLLAQWNLNHNNTPGAMTELNQLIQVAPDFAPARAQLAELYLRDGSNMPALAQLLDDSIKRMPRVPAWHQYRARMYQAQQQWAAAEKELAKAYELDKTVNRMAEYANFLLRRGKDQQALDLLMQWPKDLSNSALLQAMRGQALFRLKKPDESQAAFNLSLDLATKDSRQYNLVLPQMMAVMGGQKLLDMLGPRIANDASGEVALAAARVRLEMNQSVDAIKSLEALNGKFKADDPQEVERQRMLARAYYDQKQYDKSRAAYELVLQQQSQDLMALNNLAFLLADQMDDPQAAMPLAKRAMLAAGDNPEQRANVLDTMGWVQFCANDLRSAEDTLRRSVNLNPMPVNNLHLAKVYLAQNRPNEAQQMLMQAKTLAETQKDTQMLQQIEELLKTSAKPATSAER